METLQVVMKTKEEDQEDLLIHYAQSLKTCRYISELTPGRNHLRALCVQSSFHICVHI